LLEEDVEHEGKMIDQPADREKCHQLYSILKNCCASGFALLKINAHKSTKNGYLAWQDHCTQYYAKGDVGSYAAACLQN
jgi:hypothetical protein